MPLELLLLRHAKSDWKRDVDDFDRPLNARGRRDAEHIGQWLATHGLCPDRLLSSPARRAALTTELVCGSLGMAITRAEWIDELYLAPLETLVRTIADLAGDVPRVMLVGHNPGLEDLLLWLAPGAENFRRSGKLLTTAALARVQLEAETGVPMARRGHLVQLVRPRDIG